MKKNVSDYKEIESEGVKYKIVQWVTIMKSEFMPSTLTLLATGQDLSMDEIWKAFKNSDKIIFFICEKTAYSTTS
ncbi:MAG: hypothetical protein MUP82_10340 [Candidatus Marinimicrobia bacterium]|nr:hypothetical protein [Candidatus Neomarinimicrobiota bacterium]